jgi:hypothetical protein
MFFSIHLVASLCFPQVVLSFVIQHDKIVQNQIIFIQTTTTTIPSKIVQSNTRMFAVIGNGEEDDSNRRIGNGNGIGGQGNIPSEESSVEYTGSVDWDAEWKKVMKNKDSISSMDRPGKDFYKSEAEIAAIVRIHYKTVHTYLQIVSVCFYFHLSLSKILYLTSVIFVFFLSFYVACSQ